jgi:outer membrane protein OmpA-like peptidoglycan-associated protein
MKLQCNLRQGLATVAAVLVLCAGPIALAQQTDVSGMSVTGKIEWGLWIDADGCQHWWADGGTEGYMVPRRDPATGKPVCLQQTSCLAESTDAFFATGSAALTSAGRRTLERFFTTSDAFSYAIAGHTDSRGSDADNQALSEARAQAVAAVARSVGAVVDSETGFGESRPVASNATEEGMAKNRRVEVFCKRN